MSLYDDVKNDLAPDGAKPRPRYEPPPRYGPEWDALVAKNDERKTQEAARRADVKSSKGFEISDEFRDAVQGKRGPHESEEWRRAHGAGDGPAPKTGAKNEDEELDEELDEDLRDEFD